MVGAPTLRRQFKQVELPDEVLENGEISTRRWIVDLILDLAGYTSDRDLAKLTAVEPARGTAAFLGPMVERLCESIELHGRRLTDAKLAVRAMDLLGRNVDDSRRLVVEVLTKYGHEANTAQRFADASVVPDDYLLRDRDTGTADFVLGNPPYIRLEDIPPGRHAEASLTAVFVWQGHSRTRTSRDPDTMADSV